MTDLYKRSIEIILEHQADSGAYPACPTFPTYRYSWFRDGSFIAYAMDRIGEHESAVRFFDWAATVVIKRRDVIVRAVERARAEAPLGVDAILHTRYTLQGDAADEEWPNFQLDGFGTLLWAMGQHQLHNQADLPERWCEAVRLVVDYLAALWRQPCFDCWEEFPDQVHPHTLAAIHAGLTASQALTGQDNQSVLDAIKAFLLEHAVVNGHFTKTIGTDVVDASLLGLAVPYRLFPLEDPRIKKTIAEIEARLRKGGGVLRYATDTYYGGGEWVLLTAWLGWVYALRGDRQRAIELNGWIEAQADEERQLPEQVPVSLNDPSMYQPWVDRWGEIAKPLLWSHAMYLILVDSLENST